MEIHTNRLETHVGFLKQKKKHLCTESGLASIVIYCRVLACTWNSGLKAHYIQHAYNRQIPESATGRCHTLTSIRGRRRWPGKKKNAVCGGQDGCGHSSWALWKRRIRGEKRAGTHTLARPGAAIQRTQGLPFVASFCNCSGARSAVAP